MKIVFLLWVFAILAIVFTQPICLLQQPLKDECISSINLEMVEQQLTKYLCTISYQRHLYAKAEQFCRQAVTLSYESGYLYLNSLIINSHYNEALKVDYMLFFTNPFQHNSLLNASIHQISSQLSEKQNSLQASDSFSKAIFYFYHNKTEKSQKQLKSYLTSHSGNTQLIYQHFLMIRILQKQYKYYQALQYIKNVIKTNTIFHPYLYHIKGNFLMHHVQFQKAIAQFETANIEFHKLYNSNGFSFSNYNIGLCYQKLGKVDQAIKYYEKSIINLSSAQALNALGHAYFTQYQQGSNEKDLQNAQIYYKKSITVNPQYTIAIFNLGILQLEKPNISKAIEYFSKCQAQLRSCKYGLLKGYYKSNSNVQAQRIIGQIQKNVETISQLAAILYEMGDHHKALSIIGNGQYKSAQLYQWKGFHQYALDQYEQAQKSFSRAVFLGSKKGYIYYSLGLSQLHLKKYQECSRSFDHAYRLDPREQTKQQLQKCKKYVINSDL